MGFVVGESAKNDLAVANGTAVSAAFKAAGYKAGSVQFGAALTSASFTIEVSNEDTPTNWTALQDAAGTPITSTPATANESCPLPSGTFAYLWARIKGASNEAAGRTWRVVLSG